ncbi:hypothetical protein REPUB_Repub11eG0118800 [Reevesia pubescens]
MASKQIITLVIATVFVLTFLSGTTAQAPAPEPSAVAFGPSAEAPTPDCITNLYTLADCLTYVEAGSNLTKPDKPCCPELAGLVKSSPQCLCYLLDKNATASFGLSIDMNRALNLPTVCHVSTPPASLCSAINGAPAGAPSEGSMSPGLSPQAGNKNGASNIAVSGLASLVALAVAFLPTLFGI